MNRPRRTSALLGVALACSLVASACSSGTTAAPAPVPTATPTPTQTLTPTQTSTPTPTPTSAAATNAAALKKFGGQKLQWRTCVGSAQCANLTVPLDYARPDGSTLQIQVIRRPARDQKNRKGSVVVNPGGPGGSGYDYVAGGGQAVGPSVSQVYDVVSFDPRGVSRSAPVKCLTAAQTDAFYSYDGSPDNDAEATGAFLLGRAFANNCLKNDPTLIPYIGTRETVQDLEVLRSALGDKKLNYVGESYGTLIGALYADRFPTKVGRFVLDGAIDPTVTADGFAAGQALGFERALQDFLTDCVQRSSCPLGRDRAAAEDRLNVFLTRLDSAPLPVGKRQLTQALATLGIIASFYSKSTWPQLRSALRSGLRGDGRPLLDLADFYSNRMPDGQYANNSLDAFYAISCMDRADTNGVDATKALAVKLTETVSRTFGAYLAWGDTPCQSWPVKPTTSPASVTAAGAGPIVVVGTTRDPATPYEWAKSLANQLQSGVLVTRSGEGHTGYQAGSACVDNAVNTYLVKGVAPPDGLRCST